MLRDLLVALLVSSSLSCAFAAQGSEDYSSAIAQVVKKEAQDAPKLSYCVLLEKANAPSGEISQGERKKAIEAASQKLKMNDPSMLRARADVARKGLYRFKQDENLAIQLYVKANKSPEAAWNAALMVYQRSQDKLSAENANFIMYNLKKSGAISERSRGVVASYANYLAGLIEESGVTGQPNIQQSFLYYRNSARNGYVPGMYHYMRQLMRALPKMESSEKGLALQEMRMMSNRWKWQSPEIMMITGDLYAAKWFRDDDGFMQQYHWRMAQKMGATHEISDFDGVMRARVKRLSPEKEKKLHEAVEAGMRNVLHIDHPLEFIDICVE